MFDFTQILHPDAFAFYIIDLLLLSKINKRHTLEENLK